MTVLLRTVLVRWQTHCQPKQISLNAFPRVNICLVGLPNQFKALGYAHFLVKPAAEIYPVARFYVDFYGLS